MRPTTAALICFLTIIHMIRLTTCLPGFQRLTLVRYNKNDCPVDYCSWNDCPHFLEHCPKDYATCPKPKDSNGDVDGNFLSMDMLKAYSCKDDGGMTGYGIFHIPDWYQGTDYRDIFTHCNLTFYDERKCKGNKIHRLTEWDNRMCVNLAGSWSVRTECHAEPNHKTGGKLDVGPAEGHDGVGDDDNDEHDE